MLKDSGMGNGITVPIAVLNGKEFFFLDLFLFIFTRYERRQTEMIIECPINDWYCPYFKNGDCALGKEAKVECDAWYGLEDDE